MREYSEIVAEQGLKPRLHYYQQLPLGPNTKAPVFLRGFRSLGEGWKPPNYPATYLPEGGESRS